ncbi:MAG: hypothetical protein AUJ11_00560 [Parcubacteria group bacterium CG1_02_44_65]|uniref:Uncharacterized protein n=3 Tax=Candidatus Portnoyibacteriota TaxID=1817913 RepID=A0A2M7YL35_9BACT|nr:MAG: hypothetical protein AUJ11_00560 [Parcubacteria group bacterium CG1_02_44_65]PIP15420.1 MAG: hypothetical protein COX45_02420 [Candidatus Portnoybacteria bacterium CG23_combo_of_CG06-09_8_20_14_all_44_36]PIZ69399.1 MAG: hypothetical protein COY10_01580 [Candidatus Portnoybacteria bacterium CG_4_10_14_0_2_um_filter_43_36]PJA63690.1 MAG: hypothetical protein CO160_02345 [Candidatus Portnoybacteria bacterium CG_4_9_14_3_um_filter_43_11]PJE59432.1 MAG: hypothetical protein COU84_00870 [Cand
MSGGAEKLIFPEKRCIMETRTMTKKENFLLEHNKLSPLNLQATMLLLSRFKIEKPLLFKDNNWSIDKLRRPFILWLTSSPSGEKR